MSIYLYLKQHNTTGLKYLGQTIKDPQNYKGSGIRWLKHIKKHGYDVTTIILYETPYREDIKELGIYYSNLWSIVDSNEFANLAIEDGGVMTGRTHSDETKKKIGEKSKGRIFSEEYKQNMSELTKGENNGMFGKNHSEDSKKMMSLGHTGKKLSDETKAKIGKAFRGISLSIVKCPHCGKTGGGGSMKRWHFDNCKLKT